MRLFDYTACCVFPDDLANDAEAPKGLPGITITGLEVSEGGVRHQLGVVACSAPQAANWGSTKSGMQEAVDLLHEMGWCVCGDWIEGGAYTGIQVGPVLPLGSWDDAGANVVKVVPSFGSAPSHDPSVIPERLYPGVNGTQSL